MAWIKMRVDLPTDPAVIGIADATGLDEFSVVGRLHMFWSWADAQSRDGRDINVTPAFLNRYLRQPGFAEAMEKVGWLKIGSNSISIPRFDKHNGQNAKTRANANVRQSRHRNAPSNGSSNASSNGQALPEESREEESREDNTPLSPEGETSGEESKTQPEEISKPDVLNRDPSSPEFQEAWAAFNRWSQSATRFPLRLGANLEREVWLLIESLSEEPPIIHGGKPVAQALMIPHAVGALIAENCPWKGGTSLRYVTKAVMGKLDEWSKQGMKETAGPRTNGNSKFSPPTPPPLETAAQERERRALSAEQERLYQEAMVPWIANGQKGPMPSHAAFRAKAIENLAAKDKGAAK